MSEYSLFGEENILIHSTSFYCSPCRIGRNLCLFLIRPLLLPHCIRCSPLFSAMKGFLSLNFQLPHVDLINYNAMRCHLMSRALRLQVTSLMLSECQSSTRCFVHLLTRFFPAVQTFAFLLCHTYSFLSTENHFLPFHSETQCINN